jgi:glyoxylase-like metal-dependent hydrolase (beta-lactamase superfamily II)
MIKVKRFVFNPIQENTYILYDETKECVIIDCGCLFDTEKAQLKNFIKENGLIPKHLINTHLHFDHALGNRFIYETYGLKPEANKEDEFLIPLIKQNAKAFHIPFEDEPMPLGGYLNEGDKVCFGNSELEIFHVPGHSPGSLVFYDRKDNLLFTGDALFKECIGRTDLLGGNHQALIKNIRQKLLVLPPETIVFPGHDEETTIGHEIQFNPYL